MTWTLSFGGTLPLHTLTDDLAFEHVKGGEQSRDAMAFVIVGHGAGLPLLHRQHRLGAIERLNLALLINRQNDGVVRRIDIEADDVTQLGDELRVIGQLELTHPVGLQPVGPPDALHRADADPDCSGMAAPVQWVASGGGPAKVRVATRSTTSGVNGGIREGRVLSRHSPAMPAAPNRSCQRQITVLAFPVRRMISAVPWPSAVNRTIFARQTCFCGLFRLDITASNSTRSAALSLIWDLACIPETRTIEPAGESAKEAKCQV